MAKHNIWMSVSDLMTGLMLVFLFIAVAYMKKVQSNQSVLTQYVENRKELHDRMVSEFKDETKDGKITIKGDLSMRFEETETLFPSGDWHLTESIKDNLAYILPRYFDILLNDSMRDRIREVRIEGHTDDVPAPNLHRDPYLANVLLSQRRAFAVLEYMRSLPEFRTYSVEDRRLLEFWFTANGLSYGRALDKDNNYAIISGERVVKDKSRRVEFRIITSGDEVLENFVNNNNKQ